MCGVTLSLSTDLMTLEGSLWPLCAEFTDMDELVRGAGGEAGVALPVNIQSGGCGGGREMGESVEESVGGWSDGEGGGRWMRV